MMSKKKCNIISCQTVDMLKTTVVHNDIILFDETGFKTKSAKNG